VQKQYFKAIPLLFYGDLAKEMTSAATAEFDANKLRDNNK
jgi:hypothetical protein